jgi:capsid portal protein
MSDSNPALNVLEMLRHRPLLYGEFSVSLLKSALLDANANSSQEWQQGERVHPIDFQAADKLLQASTFHETCINAKKTAIVGLGFRNEYDKQMLAWKRDPQRELPGGDPDEPSKAYQTLEPLVDGSVLGLLQGTAEDFCTKGNAYWEIVRDGEAGDGKILGIWPIPPQCLTVKVEGSKSNEWHYLYRFEHGKQRIFARFGDKANLLARLSKMGTEAVKPKEVSEVVHFRVPTARNRYYGMPDYLSAVPAMELSQMIHQQQFDFFNNRGVPEFMLFFLGQTLPTDTWKKIEEAIKANIGQGNQHKSLAINIGDPNMKVQLEKLAVEGKTENSFQELANVLAAEIVSAHRVPPLLAGLIVPGKIGATNELPNALLAFQTLYVDQQQQLFSETIASTIGEELGLTYADLLLRKVTDRFDLDKVDTMSRMKDPMASPEGASRDLGEGVKKADDLSPKQIGEMLARIWTAVQKAKAA